MAPDNYVVAPDGPTRCAGNEKITMTVRADEGTEEVPVPEPLRRRQVLDEHKITRLAVFGSRIQDLYGTPMDAA